MQSHLTALQKLSGSTSPSGVQAGSGGQAALLGQTSGSTDHAAVGALAVAGAALLMLSAGWRVNRSRARR